MPFWEFAPDQATRDADNAKLFARSVTADPPLPPHETATALAPPPPEPTVPRFAQAPGQGPSPTGQIPPGSVLASSPVPAGFPPAHLALAGSPAVAAGSLPGRAGVQPGRPPIVLQPSPVPPAPSYGSVSSAVPQVPAPTISADNAGLQG